MQTFLPYPDFAKSASVLDTKRLNKQRAEVKQLLIAIHYPKMLYDPDWCIRTNSTPSQAYRNHPAAIMWEWYTDALARYGMAICQEWISRGYRDHTYEDLENFLLNPDEIVMPKWLGDERVHSSHRSRLLQKDYNFYKQFGWSDPLNLDYFWPGVEYTVPPQPKDNHDSSYVI